MQSETLRHSLHLTICLFDRMERLQAEGAPPPGSALAAEKDMKELLKLKKDKVNKNCKK